MVLICVDCHNQLVENHCSHCGRFYEQKNGILIAWPKTMDKLAEEEAEHHDEDDSDAIEVHQLNRPRNVFYHEQLWQEMRELPKGSSILEIGAGSGFDAQVLQDNYALTLTDVSPETLRRLSEKLNNPDIMYIAADGSRLPFANNSFDGIYMVATLHHLPNQQQGIHELARMVKSGGQVYIGIEPNSTYFMWIKYFRGLLCRLIHMDPHKGSHADAEMEGFSYIDLKKYFFGTEWESVTIRPIWFLAGWWHYGSEFLFRSLRLKKRFVLPSILEWLLIYLDEALFKIPGMKYLAWHWSVSAKKL